LASGRWGWSDGYDVFTRYIVGYYLGMRKESYFSGNLALLNAFSSKVEHCKNIGIEISEEDWFTSPICKKLVGDRGSMISNKSDALTQDLNIELINTRSQRPDEKPYVERFLGTIQSRVKKYLKGQNVIPPMKNPRIDFDARKSTWVTIKILRYCIIKAILSHNNVKPLKRYPYKKELIDNEVTLRPKNILEHYRNNNISYGTIMPERALRILLMEKRECSFSKKGIYHEMEYFTAVNSLINQKLELLLGSKYKEKLIVYFDPLNLKDTYVSLEGDFHQLRLVKETEDPIEDYLHLKAIQAYEAEQTKKNEHEYLENEAKTIKEVGKLSDAVKDGNNKTKNNLKEVKKYQDLEIKEEFSKKNLNELEEESTKEQKNTKQKPNPFENPLI